MLVAVLLALGQGLHGVSITGVINTILLLLLLLLLVLGVGDGDAPQRGGVPLLGHGEAQHGDVVLVPLGHDHALVHYLVVAHNVLLVLANLLVKQKLTDLLSSFILHFRVLSDASKDGDCVLINRILHLVLNGFILLFRDLLRDLLLPGLLLLSLGPLLADA